MNKITTIGLDLAKLVFHVVCCNQRGKVIRKRKLKRSQVLGYFAQLESCVIAMEACASAHYWARQFEKLGHRPKLIPPQHIKAYLLGNKNDYNDASAIAEAATRDRLREVAVKSEAQQDIQAIHRMRSRCLRERTALCNQIRGLLGEYGVLLPKGVNGVRRGIPRVLEDGENGLSDLFRRLLNQRYQQLVELDSHIDFYTEEVERHTRESEACQRLQTLPGYGVIVASAFHSAMGNGEAFKRGREVSAALGLVPKQHTTGDNPVLLGISKRGDGYLRSLLVHGARAVVSRAANKDDKLSLWINRIRAERGFNKAVVAMANKMARMGWAVLANKSIYQAA